MTIGQRLFAAGLLEAFQRARAARQRIAMVEMLRTVAVEDPSTSAEAILGSGPDWARLSF
jgi:hypothetical protein